MLVGALVDAGADGNAIGAAIASLQIDASVSFEKVKRGGIAATKFHVHWPEQKSHRHLSGIIKIIDRGALSDRARQNAHAIFRKLAEAEAESHMVPIEKVHFHEVGAVDSIADIVGACVAFDQLDVAEVFCSPVNVGSGTVKTEHGILPVPAPATARLLIGAPIYSQGPVMELTTPTGAAVAVTLATRFGPLPPMKVARTGHGAGTREFADQPNILRVILGDTTKADEALTVSVIEANIDDLNPQVLAWSAERLLEAGALDVTIEQIIMKKGRPAACSASSPNPRTAKCSPSRSSPRLRHSASACTPPSAASAPAPSPTSRRPTAKCVSRFPAKATSRPSTKTAASSPSKAASP